MLLQDIYTKQSGEISLRIVASISSFLIVSEAHTKMDLSVKFLQIIDNFAYWLQYTFFGLSKKPSMRMRKLDWIILLYVFIFANNLWKLISGIYFHQNLRHSIIFV